MKDYSVLDNLGCRMLDLKPYLKKAFDEGYKQGLQDGLKKENDNERTVSNDPGKCSCLS